MKAYIIITGIIFALITIAHVARMVKESTQVLNEPIFLVLTILSAALSIWALLILRRVGR